MNYDDDYIALILKEENLSTLRKIQIFINKLQWNATMEQKMQLMYNKTCLRDFSQYPYLYYLNKEYILFKIFHDNWL